MAAREARMPAKFEVNKETQASLGQAMDYYMHPENLPKLHPDFVKEVKIMSADGDAITFEQHARIMGKNLKVCQQAGPQ